MFIKLIIANTSETQCSTLSQAMQKGQSFRSARGFLMQTGGWSNDLIGQAILLQYWRDESSYTLFTHQENSVARKLHELFSEPTVLGGHVVNAVSVPEIISILNAALFVRVSDCQLMPQFSPIFVAVQMEIWNQGLTQTPGMLGATWSRVEGSKDRFLATTFWRDKEAHDYYRREVFPSLEAKANPRKHLTSLTIHKAIVEPGWRFEGDS
jgi:hypothetical protein